MGNSNGFRRFGRKIFRAGFQGSSLLAKHSKRGKVTRVALLTTLIAFLTSIFNGGFGKIASGLSQILALFEKTEQETKEGNEKKVEKEFRDIEKGERPKWDE